MNNILAVVLKGVKIDKLYALKCLLLSGLWMYATWSTLLFKRLGKLNGYVLINFKIWKSWNIYKKSLKRDVVIGMFHIHDWTVKISTLKKRILIKVKKEQKWRYKTTQVGDTQTKWAHPVPNFFKIMYHTTTPF